MALAYGTSCLLSTFFVWVLYKGKKKQKYVLASVSLALSLGLYQSYIGFSILLVIMIFIKEFLEERFRTVLGGYEIYRMWVRWVRIIPFNNEIRFENS